MAGDAIAKCWQLQAFKFIEEDFHIGSKVHYGVAHSLYHLLAGEG